MPNSLQDRRRQTHGHRHTVEIRRRRDHNQTGQCTSGASLRLQPDLPLHKTYSRRSDIASATGGIWKDCCTQQGPPRILPFLFIPSSAYSFSCLNKRWGFFPPFLYNRKERRDANQQLNVYQQCASHCKRDGFSEAAETLSLPLYKGKPGGHTAPGQEKAECTLPSSNAARVRPQLRALSHVPRPRLTGRQTHSSAAAGLALPSCQAAPERRRGPERALDSVSFSFRDYSRSGPCCPH